MANTPHSPVVLDGIDPSPRAVLVGSVVGSGSVRAGLTCAATMALAAVPVAALGLADGGYYPRPWGWTTLALSLTVVVVLSLGRSVAVSVRALVLLGVLALLGAWIAASLLWTRSAGLTVFELERWLVYVVAIGAAALVVRPGRDRALATGVFLGAAGVTVWGLITYLAAREQAVDVFQGAYLHRPLGYANGMAILSVLAILLGLGIVTDSSSRVLRVGAAVGLVPLASALALTGSRAAAATLLVGLGVALALGSARSRVFGTWLSVLIVPALAVLLVTAADPTDSGIDSARADRLGERLLLALLALSLISLVPATLATRSGSFRAWPRFSRAAWIAAAVVSLGAVLAIGATRVSNLAGDRPTYWRVAIEELDRSDPLVGAGAGTFGQVWLERRPIGASVRDAHSIVVESLSELGVTGMLVVLALLGAPLVWGARSRRRPLVPATTRAFAAYAIHASVDWDWELPAITVAAFFCAVALAGSADGPTRRLVPGPIGRAVGLVLAAGAAALGLVGFVGASAQEEATRALAHHHPAAAEHAARRAERWQPWAVDPLLIHGRALVALGDRSAAGALFAKAAARDPNDYRAWLALAAVAEGDLRDAAMQRARVLNPRAVRLSGS